MLIKIISLILIMLYWLLYFYLWFNGCYGTRLRFFKLWAFFSLMTVIYIVSETAFLVVSGAIFLFLTFLECKKSKNFDRLHK
jgi:hypothetical protein